MYIYNLSDATHLTHYVICETVLPRLYVLLDYNWCDLEGLDLDNLHTKVQGSRFRHNERLYKLPPQPLVNLPYLTNLLGSSDFDLISILPPKTKMQSNSTCY